MENKNQPINPIVNNDGFCTSFENLKQPDGGAIGLTKREYFAGLAMQGLISNSRVNINDVDNIKACIKVADELLKQLDNGNK